MSVISDIFRSDTEKSWQKLASEIGGEFIDGGFWNSDKVILNYRKTKIILDTYTVHSGMSLTYNRLRCPFVSKNGITFEISPEKKLNYINDLFSIKKTETGNAEFDDKIHCSSKHLKSFRSFLDSNLLQEKYFSILQNTDVEVSIREITRFFSLNHTPPIMNNWITLERLGKELDIEKLKSWFDLCKLTFDRLIEIGEAKDISPEYQ
jgi:hypothetical protein